MADESEPSPQMEMVQDDEKKLKYLEFVQVALIYAAVCFSSVYEYAKENSGPLKTGVHAVEGTVKTLVGPVYEKFHDVPFELLKFVDRKVGESLGELERHVSSLVRQASSQARAVPSEMQRAGVLDVAKSITKTVYTKYEPAARELYTRYEPAGEQYAVSAWRWLNRLPLVAHIAVPTAAYCSEKYNRAVCIAADRGFATASYLQLIPVERIAKVFDEVKVGGGGSGSAGPVVTVLSTNGEAH